MGVDVTRYRSFALGVVAGIAATVSIGTVPISAVPTGAVAARSSPEPMPPVEVTLHRFDMVPGSEAQFAAWMGFLHAHHREAVGTLARERTYFEAMFTAPDEPRRLYWITVNGAGGAVVDTSPLDVDRRHIAYMDAVLAKGSHRWLATQNVLAPDFIVAAVRQEQRREP